MISLFGGALIDALIKSVNHLGVNKQLDHDSSATAHLKQHTWAAFNKATFSLFILYLLKGYCNPVLCDLKLESIRYSGGQDLMLCQVNYINNL